MILFNLLYRYGTVESLIKYYKTVNDELRNDITCLVKSKYCLNIRDFNGNAEIYETVSCSDNFIDCVYSLSHITLLNVCIKDANVSERLLKHLGKGIAEYHFNRPQVKKHCCWKLTLGTETLSLNEANDVAVFQDDICIIL